MDPKSVLLGLREKSVGLSKAQTRIPWREIISGTIWPVIVDIHGAVQAIGLALLVLFFVVGVVKTCGSFAEVKKPEHAREVVYPFRSCQRRRDLWLGADDGTLYDCAGLDLDDHERRRLWLGK